MPMVSKLQNSPKVIGMGTYILDYRFCVSQMKAASFHLHFFLIYFLIQRKALENGTTEIMSS